MGVAIVAAIVKELLRISGKSLLVIDPTDKTIDDLRKGVRAWLNYHDRRPRTILAGPSRGIKLLLRKRGDRQKWLGLYEIELEGFYARYIKSGMTVFDIGAADGDTTLMFAKRVGPQGKVFAFEPDDEPFGHLHRLSQNLKLNPDLAPRIEVVPHAVGDTFLLDDFAATSPPTPPDFVKVDTDGAEVEVLMAAHKILTVTRPVWLIEVHSLDLEYVCLDILRTAHYATTIINPAWWRVLWLKEGRPIAHNRWIGAWPK